MSRLAMTRRGKSTLNTTRSVLLPEPLGKDVLTSSGESTANVYIPLDYGPPAPDPGVEACRISLR